MSGPFFTEEEERANNLSSGPLETDINVLEFEETYDNPDRHVPSEEEKNPSAPPKIPSRSLYENIQQSIRESEGDVIRGFQREKATEEISKFTGIEEEEVSRNFEGYAEAFSGSKEPLGVIDYVKNQYKAGKAFYEANEAMRDYIYSGDPEDLKRYEDAMEKAPELGAAPNKIASVLGMVSQNTPQLLESFSTGQKVAAVGTLAAAGALKATGVGAPAGAALLGTAGKALGLGTVWTGLSMAGSAAESQKQIQGGYLSEVYQASREAGVPFEEDTARIISSAASIPASAVDSLPWLQTVATIPGAEKFVRSAFQEATVNAMLKAKDRYLKTMASKAVARGAAEAVGRGTAVGISEGGTEVIQGMITDLGYELYRNMEKGNYMSEDKARAELIKERGRGNFTQRDVNDYRAQNAERIPKKTIKEMADGYLMEFVAGAVVGGAFSAPGVAMRSVRAGTTEYSVQKAKAKSVVADIVRNAESPEAIVESVRSNEELQRIMGGRELEREARVFEVARDYKKLHEDRAALEAEGREEVVWRSEDGEIYNLDGYKLERPPEGAVINDVVATVVDQKRVYLDKGTGKTYSKPPWDPSLHLDADIGPPKKLNVHRNPDDGKYYDQFGNVYGRPPEGDNVEVWEWEGVFDAEYTPIDSSGLFEFEDAGRQRITVGILNRTDPDGNTYQEKRPFFGSLPWEPSYRFVAYKDPETGQNVERVIVTEPQVLSNMDNIDIINESSMRIREEQAQALYQLYLDDADMQTDLDTFEEFVEKRGIIIDNDLTHRFAADMETDMRNFSHIRDYAKRFAETLPKEQRDFFRPAVEKLDQIIKSLNAGSSELRTMQDVMNDYGEKIDSIYNRISALRAQRKNEANKTRVDMKEIRRLDREIFDAHTERLEQINESRMFTDLLTKTNVHIARAYHTKFELNQRLNALAEAEAKWDEKVANVQDSADMALRDIINENFQESTGTDPQGPEMDFFQLAVDDNKMQVELGMNDVEWYGRRSRVLGKLETLRDMVINRQQSGIRKFNQARAIELAQRVLAEVPDNVHMKEADKIRALQKLIDPYFRRATKAAEMSNEWQRKYNELVDIVRKGRRDPESVAELDRAEVEGQNKEVNDAIEAALEAAEKPLNEMSLQDLQNLHYAVEMIKAVGKARLDQQNMMRRVRTQAIIDHTIDMVKGLDMDRIQASVDTKQFQSYMEDSTFGKKKRTVLSLFLTKSQLFDKLDGGGAQYNGPLTDFFIKDRNRSHGEMKNQLNRRRQGFNDFLKSIDYDQKYLTRTINVLGKDISIQTAMTYYVAMGEEGGSFAPSQDLKDALIDANGVSEGAMRAAIEQLSEKEKMIVDYLLSDYKEVFPRLARTYANIKNKALKEIETYVPLVSKYMTGERPVDDLFAEMMETSYTLEPSIPDEMVMERSQVSPQHRSPVRTELVDVWQVMSEREERFINMAELVRDFRRVIDDKDFKQAVRAELGEGWYNSIKDYVDSQANPYYWKEYNTVNRFFSGVRHNSAISYIAANVQTMVKQAPSIAFFVREAGLRNFIASAAQYTAGGEFLRDGNIRKYLKDVDPEFKWRQSEVETIMMSRDQQIHQAWRSGRENFQNLSKSKLNRLGEASMSWIKWMDSQVVAIGENAMLQAYKERTDFSEADAVAAVQEMVQRTQPSADPGMLQSIYKSGEFLRTALLFTQQRMKIMDMIAYDIPEQIRTQRYMKAMGTMAMIQASALGIILADKKRMPEDGEEMAKWFSEYWLTFPVILGDIASSAIHGYSNMNPASQAVADVIRTARKLGRDSYTPDEKKKDAVKTILDITSLTAPYPGAPIRNFMKAAENDDPFELIGGVEERETWW